MRLHNAFTVAAPLTRTWETLLDVERVAGCLPGASVEPVGQDGLYRGGMRMTVGPVTTAYRGTVRLLDVDADAHVASFDARAKEAQGTGTAAAVIRNRLEPAGDGTRVVVETELDVTGRPAQLGRGLMEDVAAKMLTDFAGRLEEAILIGTDGPGHPQAAFDMGSMHRRGYGRELGLAGALVALLIALVLRRRPKGLLVSGGCRR
ncbi:MAG: SRPBCC family protein [Solirubrobacterales bacterium]